MPSPARVNSRWVLASAGVMTVVAIGVAAFRPPPPADAAEHLAVLDGTRLPVPRDIRLLRDELDAYVDEKSCAGCHPQEAGAHVVTPHANSARLASVARDAAIFQAAGELHDQFRDAHYRAAVQDQRLVVRGRKSQDRAAAELNFAVGSGENGIAYLGLRPDGSALMPRVQAYFKQGKAIWGWTPGLEPEATVPSPLGTVIPPDELARCLACHSTAVAMKEGRVDLPASRIGIGCQRCHGPAAKHLELARRGGEGLRSSADPGLPRLAALSGAEEMALCGACHRPLTPPQKGTVPDDLARLQGIALRMSRCTSRSQRPLTCSTCHDPHAPASREAAHYEKACGSCHSGPGGKRCRVNPQSGCVGCHLGREELTLFGSTLYTNHWIRKRPTPVAVQPGGRGSAPGRAGR